MKEQQFVPSHLQTRATAALDKKVAEELKKLDPSPEQAKAVLQPKPEEEDG